MKTQRRPRKVYEINPQKSQFYSFFWRKNSNLIFYGVIVDETFLMLFIPKQRETDEIFEN